MEGLEQVSVKRVSLGLLARALAPDRVEHLRAVAERAVPLLAGRVVWNINSTAKGGGVAEMLQTLLAYGRGAGVDTRWLVLRGEEEFFAITKRLHNRLHGAAGDGGPLGHHEHDEYAKVQQANLELMKQVIRPQDIVLLHDPQTAGLVDGLRELGAIVIWRCHIGCDEQNQWSEHAWAFLKTYAEHADAFIFSREAYAPQWVRRDALWVIPPSIDPFSAKNREMAPEEVRRVLVRTGIIAGADDGSPLNFERRDGSHGEVRRIPRPDGRRSADPGVGPARHAGQPVGPPQGHDRCAHRLRHVSHTGRRAPAAGGARHLRGHRRPRGRRGAAGVPRPLGQPAAGNAGQGAPGEPADGRR